MGFWDIISDAFSRDGSVTCILEKIPVVGYGVATVQAITGNPDHAKRALATSTNSLITTAGAVGGFVVGGPLGAVAGGALASQVGMVTEFGISKTIDDDKVKGDVGALSIKRALVDAAIGGATGLIGGGAGTVGKIAIDASTQAARNMAIKSVANAIASNTGKEAGKARHCCKCVANNGDNDPKPKKEKIRVVTIAQECVARQVNLACKKFAKDVPLQAIVDAYDQFALYWDTFVVVGKPWYILEKVMANAWAINLQVEQLRVLMHDDFMEREF
ncbi:hypothetical protein KI688_003722 [Linnemannia hyalina]|uniref:Uncharacterized protein n=1 Tax=Linnemannia hyalina TaxID=64524 RepID=A0A9P7XP76_9FUNG|nr:hypothetical protein KI688_003722 [Linnemannia hyalina]